MELNFDQEQQQIKDAARRFLEQECTPALVRRMREEGSPFPDDIWKQMADLGWLGLPFDTQHGGSQCDWVSLAAVVEELGRACDPTPFVDSVLNCGWLLQDTASAAQKERWLPPLMAGELTLALAMLEDGSGSHNAYASSLTDNAGALLLRGRKLFVEDAASRDLLVVTARHQRNGHLCLALVAPGTRGVDLIRLHSLAHPNLYEVVFDDVILPADQVIGIDTDLAPALDHAILRSEAFQSAAAAGGARRVLELGVAYAKERQQFGRPIGSFQAVQHLLANAWIDVETAWLAAYEAITHCELGLPAADKIAVARCVSNETFTRSCFTAHQVFGGMGFMWETDLHLWTRKAKQIELAFGGLKHARARLAAAL
ncbi:MAG: acyl-CoA/acyl-ACP dehydrogenase [Pseudomonadales bacterium]|nr:acyl-CoA/acyl-ACP dehydrogenase [Pseudomonadales bacterium]